jgi:hypothetical protein
VENLRIEQELEFKESAEPAALAEAA